MNRPTRLPLIALGALTAFWCPWARAHATAAPSKPFLSPAIHSRSVITHGSVVINGKTIRYTARAGTLIMRNAKMQPIASIFYIAYLRRDIRNKSLRPITFAYNGGPGSAANWVDFGGLGPMRVALPPHSGYAKAPPYAILPNHLSILRRTDLVFIDPVGTGFSHTIGQAKPQQFWGIDADAHSVGAFIMRYLTKFNRWNSPKFILGESYGTTRSAVLSNYLQHHGVQLNGVILLSSILNFETASFAPGNDLPYILYLPSEAAVAWYHHRLNPRPKNLPAFLKRVEHFATGAYAHALMMGDTLNPEVKSQVIAKLVRYTSIPAHLWRRADLRITGSEFQGLLLNSENKQTGRLDARYDNYKLVPMLPAPLYSTMSDAINGPLTDAYNWYVENVLHYHSKRHYTMLSDEALRFWKWKHQPAFFFPGARALGYPNVAPDLERAMITNPHLELLVNSGYFDMGTPFYATMYTMDHLGLPQALRNHVHLRFYYSGHVLYISRDSRHALEENIDRFILASTRE